MVGMESPAARISLPDQRGFTIVEVMVAMLVLVIGVLGTVALIDGANARTTGTKQREAATNLAREMVETARGVPYAQLTSAAMPAAMQARPGLADADAGNPWRIDRRPADAGTAFRFTVEEASVCSIDQPGDGTGNTTTAGGYCSAGTAGSFVDRDPEDIKRVIVRISWNSAGARGEVRQTTLIHPGRGGPKITSFTETSNTNAGVSFQVAFTGGPARVEFHVNGVNQTPIVCPDPCASPWSFTWNNPLLPDGTYVVTVQAYDRSDRTAGASARTVVLNRLAPVAPKIVGGGFNNLNGSPFGAGFGNFVEIEWGANPESDVVGYRVYRGGSLAAGTGTLVDCTVTPTREVATSCIDRGSGAPTSGRVYHIVAYDLDAAGNPREGDRAALPVDWPNGAPYTPKNLAATRTGNTTTLTWSPGANSLNKLDPDKDTIDYYRIYRDGMAVANRVARDDDFVWADTNNGGTTHTYYVTAKDDEGAESAPISVTR